MLERDKTALIVIDIQDILLPKDESVAKDFLDKTVKLIQCAHVLEIPVLATEQNPEKLGGTNSRVREALGGRAGLAKLEFSCWANAGFREAVKASGKTQMLVVGMETHICVMQTVLECLEAGYGVFVVRDALLSSRKEEYRAGLRRMESAGAEVVTTQMSLFELLRAAGTPAFRKMLPLLK